METDKLQAYEAQARALDEKINTEEKRLYGGQIRLPKAILEVEQELSMLRRQRSALDDAIIDQMARVERLQDEVKHARTRAEVVEAHFAGESALLREERQRLLDQARVLIEQRKTLARNLPAALLQTYESVRSRRPDTPAVALIKAGACSQCGEAVSSADAQRAHTGDRLVFCANCGRILYLP
ncbi:MAG: hypothetical protein RMM31_05750 [Anaerolineae bacterium]|nr:hypothetical protein [Anaerolineae bacterium]